MKSVLTAETGFAAQLWHSTSANSGFFSQVDYLGIARHPGVVWRIYYEPRADFSILVDCAGGPRAFAEAHYPWPDGC